jgi:hypothetical protein
VICTHRFSGFPEETFASLGFAAMLVYEYLGLVAVSCYAVARLKFFRMNGAIRKTTFKLCAFTQFVFVLDVIVTIVLAITERRLKERCQGYFSDWYLI